MKKAKIMLAMIAVLGIVGGTLAFKAQKYFTSSYYYLTTIAGKTYGFTGATTTNPGGETTTAGYFTTSTTGPYTIYDPGALPVLYVTDFTKVYVALGE